jgi:pyridoxine 5-phosphate synthase
LREDRRHIRDEDVERLRQQVATRLNLEMAATDEMIAIAERIAPEVITLVPERREERTTEGGLDLEGQRAAIERVIAMAHAKAIRVSLFIAPDEESTALARLLGADQIELHTGEYCNATGALRHEQLARLAHATACGLALGLEVAAGHGLTRHNVGDVVAIDGMNEVNIGHALVADAVLFGLNRAVRDMRAAIDRGVRRRFEPAGPP